MDNIVIKNVYHKEWDLMKPMYEVVVNGHGKRKLNPSLKFTVTGLNPMKHYEIRMFFMRSVEKVKFNETEFEKFEMVADETPQSIIWKAGADLMRMGIDFSFLRLVTLENHNEKGQVVVVRGNYVYYPKMMITEIGDRSKWYEHSDENLRFLVRTYETNRIVVLRRRLKALRGDLRSEPSHHNPQSLVTMPSVVVKSANEEEWEVVQPMAEVDVRNFARYLDPPLKFTVTGLDEKKKYGVRLAFSRSELFFDPTRPPMWVEDKQRISLEPRLGEYWLRSGIDFSFLHLSTVTGFEKLVQLVVIEKHVYVPKLIITECDNRCAMHEYLDKRHKFLVVSAETSRGMDLKKKLKLLRARTGEPVRFPTSLPLEIHSSPVLNKNADNTDPPPKINALEALRKHILLRTKSAASLRSLPSVVVKSANKEEWEVVQPMAEVPVGNFARLLDPPLKFTVTGLDEKKKYGVRLAFSRSAFCSESASKAIWEEDKQRISLEPRLGEYWMTAGIDFSFLHLSTVGRSESLVVIEKHVYVPKLIITEYDNRHAMHEHLDKAHKFLVVSAETPRRTEFKKKLKLLRGRTDRTPPRPRTLRPVVLKNATEPPPETNLALRKRIVHRTNSSSSPLKTIPSVVITNANQKEWDLMKPLCELRVEKSGRLLDPPLKFTVTGLDEDKRYEVEMTFSWSKIEEEGQSGKEEWYEIDQSIVLESKLGSDWMSDGIDFSSLSLTTHIPSGNTHKLLVLEGYVYLPKLVITEVNDDSKVHEHLDQTLKFNVVRKETPYSKKLEKRLKECRKQRLPEDLADLSEKDLFVVPEAFRNAPNEIPATREPVVHRNPPENQSSVQNGTMKALEPFPLDSHLSQQPAQMNPFGNYPHPPDPHPPRPNGYFDGSHYHGPPGPNPYHPGNWGYQNVNGPFFNPHPMSQTYCCPPGHGAPSSHGPYSDYHYQHSYNPYQSPKIHQYHGYGQQMVVPGHPYGTGYYDSDKNDGESTDTALIYPNSGEIHRAVQSGTVDPLVNPSAGDNSYHNQRSQDNQGKESMFQEFDDFYNNYQKTMEAEDREKELNPLIYRADTANQGSVEGVDGSRPTPLDPNGADNSNQGSVEGGECSRPTPSDPNQADNTNQCQGSLEANDGDNQDKGKETESLRPDNSYQCSESGVTPSSSLQEFEDFFNNYCKTRDSEEPLRTIASVAISNANQKEWDLVQPLCEMFVRPQGARIDPPFMFSVAGLEEKKSYAVKLTFSRSEDIFKYHRFWENNVEKWQETSLSLSLAPHLGAELMSKGIDFSFARISNVKGDERQVVVQSRYVYLPKLVITEVEDPLNVHEFQDDKLKFLVMTYESRRALAYKKQFTALNGARLRELSRKLRGRARKEEATMTVAPEPEPEPEGAVDEEWEEEKSEKSTDSEEEEEEQEYVKTRTRKKRRRSESPDLPPLKMRLRSRN